MQIINNYIKFNIFNTIIQDLACSENNSSEDENSHSEESNEENNDIDTLIQKLKGALDHHILATTALSTELKRLNVQLEHGHEQFIDNTPLISHLYDGYQQGSLLAHQAKQVNVVNNHYLNTNDSTYDFDNSNIFMPSNKCTLIDYIFSSSVYIKHTMSQFLKLKHALSDLVDSKNQLIHNLNTSFRYKKSQNTQNNTVLEDSTYEGTIIISQHNSCNDGGSQNNSQDAENQHEEIFPADMWRSIDQDVREVKRIINIMLIVLPQILSQNQKLTNDKAKLKKLNKKACENINNLEQECERLKNINAELKNQIQQQNTQQDQAHKTYCKAQKHIQEHIQSLKQENAQLKAQLKQFQSE